LRNIQPKNHRSFGNGRKNFPEGKGKSYWEKGLISSLGPTEEKGGKKNQCKNYGGFGLRRADKAPTNSPKKGQERNLWKGKLQGKGISS